MRMLLTTFEASEKHGVSMSHLRLLMRTGKIKGREANITSNRTVWLIEESSLIKYLKTDRKPGPKPQKRKS
ncbi:MAG TPA: DNA-binding protein [Candidatus Omnitrophica bacterium]|nr:DNA-binding protein [Candidatus Omnitrophota bacterium]